jgi:hypothetical protein
MAWWIPALATLGIATWAIKEIAEWAEEKEKRRIRFIQQQRRHLVKKKGIELRRLAILYINGAIKSARDERDDIIKTLDKLRFERDKARKKLTKLKKKGRRDDIRELRKALDFFDDVIEEKYAEAFRYTLFIEEAIRRRERMYDSEYDGEKPKYKQLSWVKSLHLEEFFKSTDVPMKLQTVQSFVRGRLNRRWFELPFGIKGRLKEGEIIDKNLNAGDSLDIFIEEINYIDRTAVVSIEKSLLIDKLKNGIRRFNATVIDSNDFGAVVSLYGARVFIPSRFYRGIFKIGQSVDIKIIEPVDLKLRHLIAEPVY